jgi:hypothetical protein
LADAKRPCPGREDRTALGGVGGLRLGRVCGITQEATGVVELDAHDSSRVLENLGT